MVSATLPASLAYCSLRQIIVARAGSDTRLHVQAPPSDGFEKTGCGVHAL
ncbi:MAG: hypothetical protein FGF48_09875 [Candidatus Brockarchaeota archaeon]|nr:hypothetical protein [Candidatus Brockarchaeota archaeon]